MRDVRTFLVVGGVVALVALGALAASVAGGGDDSANGSVPVDDVGQLAGSWLVVNDASAPAVTHRLGAAGVLGRRAPDRPDRLQRPCAARCRSTTACSSPAR